MARAVRPMRMRDERARRQAAEDQLFAETAGSYAALQYRADDPLRPLATRGPDFTPFTDDELEDF
ncbi:hypothetical protein A2J03_25710 [Rhodococcus sp. EPR-157]|uniref:hypothetical protein n=1 Tax=Rhodococcus sp. EPR-157 TaxID=1813677 RepID=UPI0007BC7B12|nr:hypothetical protein [Rhodococcus sp. EPR-157]KZF04790.1 hypothetical protein A2J03_25710 [Rhodococcus sp. EPR-157]